MCGGSASSEGGSGGNYGGNDINDYLPSNFDNMSYPDNVIYLEDHVENRLYDEMKQIFNDPNIERGSHEAKREVERIDKIENQIEKLKEEIRSSKEARDFLKNNM